MSIREVIFITTFFMFTITMICQYIDTNVPKVSDVLQLMNILPCYEIKVYRAGRCLTTIELMKYINSPVKYFSLKDGILNILIY